MGGNVEYIHLA